MPSLGSFAPRPTAPRAGPLSVADGRGKGGPPSIDEPPLEIGADIERGIDQRYVIVARRPVQRRLVMPAVDSAAASRLAP